MDELIDETLAPVPVPAPGADLSEAIARSVARDPLDRVRCVRLFDDCYRCNWWAPSNGGDARVPMADWAVSAMHRVRKSRFLRVTSQAGELMIKDAAGE